MSAALSATSPTARQAHMVDLMSKKLVLGCQRAVWPHSRLATSREIPLQILL